MRRPLHPATPRLAAGLATMVTAGLLLAGCGGGGGGKKVTVTTASGGGPATVTVEARDVSYDITGITAPAGSLEVNLIEIGTLSHTLVVEGVQGFRLTVTLAAKNDSGTVDLAAGTYAYYCDIPGHRGQGMEGTLTIE